MTTPTCTVAEHKQRGWHDRGTPGCYPTPRMTGTGEYLVDQATLAAPFQGLLEIPNHIQADGEWAEAEQRRYQAGDRDDYARDAKRWGQGETPKRWDTGLGVRTSPTPLTRAEQEWLGCDVWVAEEGETPVLGQVFAAAYDAGHVWVIMRDQTIRHAAYRELTKTGLSARQPELVEA